MEAMSIKTAQQGHRRIHIQKKKVRKLQEGGEKEENIAV